MERPGATEFLQAVKEGNLEKVKIFLAKTKYHVYDFDNVKNIYLI